MLRSRSRRANWGCRPARGHVDNTRPTALGVAYQLVHNAQGEQIALLTPGDGIHPEYQVVPHKVAGVDNELAAFYFPHTQRCHNLLLHRPP